MDTMLQHRLYLAYMEVIEYKLTMKKDSQPDK
jgi:hypothetical protein